MPLSAPTKDAALPLREQARVIELHVGGRDHRIPVLAELFQPGRLRASAIDQLAGVLDAVDDQRPAVVLAGLDEVQRLAIATELRRILREGKFGGWFGRVDFHGIVDGVLHLSTPSGIAADRIRSDFIPDIRAAAESADVFVERVVVTMRKG
jgi:hypothetical protein